MRNFNKKNILMNTAAVIVAALFVGGAIIQTKKEADAQSFSIYAPVGGDISIESICCNGIVLDQGKVTGSGTKTGDMIFEWQNLITGLKANYKIYSNVTDLGLVRTVGAYCLTILSECETEQSEDGTYVIAGTNG